MSFTYYKKCTDVERLENIVQHKINWNFSLPAQIDGYLAIVVYKEGKNSLYIKLKPHHIIELEYSLVDKTLHTFEKDFDILSVVIVERFDTQNLYWYKTCLDSDRAIVEFEIQRNNGMIENGESLWKFVKLTFVKIRYDKFSPDNNAKTKKF